MSAAAALVVLGVSAAGAEETAGVGVGMAECSKLPDLLHQDPQLRNRLTNWTEGFLSGLSEQSRQIGAASKNLGEIAVDARQAQIIAYCAAHPGSLFLNGAYTVYLWLAEGGPVRSSDCQSTISRAAILGCTSVIESATDQKTRADALVRRGEAYAKQADYASAVMDFIAALDADPGNAAASNALFQWSPGPDPSQKLELPPPVEGVDFPRGFDPTVEKDVKRPGRVARSFTQPSGHWEYCQAACFADEGCRSWEYSPPMAGPTGTHASCQLMADVAEPRPAPGEISGTIRPELPTAAAAGYVFVDGEAFGLRMEAPEKWFPLSASAFPTTGPGGLSVSKPHPMLTGYSGYRIYRGALCQVTGSANGFAASSKGQTLLRELVAAFGKPAAGSWRGQYVWNVNSATARVILEHGPKLTIEFKNHSDCSDEQKALNQLRSAKGDKISEADLQEIFDRWPPLPAR